MNSNYIELTIYFLIVSLALIFAVIKQPKLSASTKLLMFIVVGFGLSVAVRLNGFDADIQTYADSMSFESLSLYYLREPVVWFGQRFWHYILGNEVLVFIVSDLLMLLTLYCAFSNYRLPYYAFFAVLTFFPFILGMQNVYRQWVSVIFCLLAFSYLFNSSKSLIRYLGFFLAGLSHNVAGVFLGPFLILSRSIVIRLFGGAVLLLTPAIIHFASGTKSSTSTGANLALAYVLAISFIVVFMILSMRFKVYRREFKLLTILLSVFFVVIVSVIILGSTAAERIGLFSLCLLYPHLILFCDRYYKQKILLRASIVILGFTPLFLFGTRDFLL